MADPGAEDTCATRRPLCDPAVEVSLQGRIQHVIITGGCTVILAHAQVVGGGAVRTLVRVNSWGAACPVAVR